MTGSIIPFRTSYKQNTFPPIVFAEMFRENLESYSAATPRAHTVLNNCRMLLQEARKRGFPVAFANSKSYCANEDTRSWIDGFRPQRHDMVFEPSAASCYSSPEFAEAMTDIGGRFVLAGFLGESVCLATVIDAATFGHRAGLIEDAISSRSIFGDPVDSHRVVVGTASRYAAILMTADWQSNDGSVLVKLGAANACR